MRTRSTAAAASILACLVLDSASAADGRGVTYNLDIPAQNLNDALQALAIASQHKLLYASELIDSESAPAVKGAYTSEQAVRQLLDGTDLTYEISDGLLLIRARDEGEAGGGSVADTRGSSPAAGGEERTELEEIVVTAQKRAEPLKDVPISVSVLSGADMDKASFVNVADALKTVPGVALTQLDSGVKLNIRGVGAAFGSSPIGYYLDSIPFGLVKTDLTPNQNAYDLARVEVLRGPQGTLYGVNAENGLVRVLTREADQSEFGLKGRASTSTTQGGAASYRGDAAINVPLIEGKLAARAVVGYEDSGGWIDGPRGNDLNDGRLRNYRLKVNAQPTGALSIGLSWWRTRDDYGGFNKSLADDSGRTLSDIPESLGNDFDAYGLKIDYAFAGFSVSSMTSYLDYANTSVYDLSPDIYAGIAFPVQRLDTTQKAKLRSEELILNSTSPGPWRWTAGMIYRNAYDTVYQPSLGGGIPFSYKYSSESYAGFGELGRRFGGDRFELTLGLRSFHDRVGVLELINQVPGSALYDQKDSYDSTTPRVVLKWNPNQDAMLYASWSQGFRSGFPQDPSVGKAFPDFPALKPDKLTNYEMGAKWNLWDGHLDFDTAVYYMDWKDVQQPLTVPFQQTLVYAPVNGQSASGMGVDLGVGFRPLRGLQLDVAISWNDLTQDEDVYTGGNLLFLEGDRLAFSPEYSANASAKYRFPMGSSGFEGEFAAAAHYLSAETTFEIEFFGTDRVKLSGDPSWVSRSSFAVLSPRRWTATLFVDNLGNWDGRFTRSQIANWTERFRPRTIGLQFDYDFAGK